LQNKIITRFPLRVEYSAQLYSSTCRRCVVTKDLFVCVLFRCQFGPCDRLRDRSGAGDRSQSASP